MLRSAIGMCNPLHEDSRGYTAVQLLEKTLAEADKSLLPNQAESTKNSPMGMIIRSARIPTKTDRQLLARMKKNYDDMSSYLNLGVVKEQPSIESTSKVPMEIDTNSNENNDKKRKKTSRKKTRISPFHNLPPEVCALIHGFICPQRQGV